MKLRKPKQLELFKENVTNKFGGELLRGKRKSRRPLSTRRPIHLVFRGDFLLRAQSRESSLRKHQNHVRHTLDKFAIRFSVRIYGRAVNSNHLHLQIKILRRDDFNNFVRAVAGVIARATKIKWTLRPFTRIGHWGRDFAIVGDSVLQNRLEACGAIAYKHRSGRKKSKATQFCDDS